MAEMVPAVGGPLDGKTVPAQSFTRALLLVNKPAGEALVYDRYADRLVARQIESFDPERAVRAAVRPDCEVLAYSDERMGPWQR